MASATTVAAGRPDVELRLSANEADVLKFLLGVLGLNQIRTILEDEVGKFTDRETYEVTSDIWNVLDDLDY